VLMVRSRKSRVFYAAEQEVYFIVENGGGPGVRLRKRDKKAQ